MMLHQQLNKQKWETLSGEEINQSLPPFRAIKVKETIATPLKTVSHHYLKRHISHH